MMQTTTLAHFGRKLPIRTHRTFSTARLQVSFFDPNCTQIRNLLGGGISL
jgi:hypothetical protein